MDGISKHEGDASEERLAEIRDSVRNGFAELRRTLAEWQSTQVDVSSTGDDSELSDHLLLRLAANVAGSPDGVQSLSEDLRAWYVTRTFEDEVGSGGPTGFLAFGGEAIATFVADGYRRLGLLDAADRFEEFWSSPAMTGLRTDIEANVAEDELWRLINEIGENHEARVAYVRARPTVFSI